MGFSTSAAFIILVTAGVTAALGLQGAFSTYSSDVEGSSAEQSARMTEQIYTDIKIVNYSTYVNRTYYFDSGSAQVDKWAAWNDSQPTNPPPNGPFIPGEVNFANNQYNQLANPTNSYADTSIDNGRYAIQHFFFTIYENPEAIFNLSVYWEGYGTQNLSYVYIWNYYGGWELIGIGTSTSSDNLITKDLTVNNADISDYIDKYGYLHLLVTSYESSGNQRLRTDFIKVFTEVGGLWVENTGETILDPLHAVLFDNSAYVPPSRYVTNMRSGYWDPTEILVLKYNPSPGSHLFKVTTENGVTDSYIYAP